MRPVFIFLIFALGFVSVANAQVKGMKNSNDPYTSCQLIKKESLNKKQKSYGNIDYYLRCSIQDYYIKFCESKITRKDITPYLNSGISVKMNIKEGEWDRCPGDPVVQSRVGTYVQILDIKK